MPGVTLRGHRESNDLRGGEEGAIGKRDEGEGAEIMTLGKRDPLGGGRA